MRVFCQLGYDEIMELALKAFHDLLGPKGFSTDPDTLAPWLTDWRGRYTGKAAAMLSPASTQEVSGIVQIALKHQIALVPQGGNSGMVAGATPDNSGNQVMLSLRRMNAIEGIDAASGPLPQRQGLSCKPCMRRLPKKPCAFP
jgi:hypothetical protein